MTPESLTWQPLGDQILVRSLIAADRTASGLILPEQHREKPQTGIVMAIGPGTWEQQEAAGRPGGDISDLRNVQRGDLVAFGKFAGVTFTLDTGEDVLLMRETEILARKPVGQFDLVRHTVAHGIGEKTVMHEAGARCEHCPEEPKSAFLEEERRRLVQP